MESPASATTRVLPVGKGGSGVRVIFCGTADTRGDAALRTVDGVEGAMLQASDILLEAVFIEGSDGMDAGSSDQPVFCRLINTFCRRFSTPSGCRGFGSVGVARISF